MHKAVGKDNCPICNYEVDTCSSPEDDKIPVPGDLSVCFKCGAYLYFEEDMKLGLFPEVLYNDLDERTKNKLKIIRHYIKQIKPLTHS